jgi:hypothetical protein
MRGAFRRYARTLPTPVGTSVVEARWQDDTVHLRWYVPGRVGAEVQVERRQAGADWATIGASTVRVNGTAEFTDATVTPGSIVAYRLRLNGRVEPASEVELLPLTRASRLAFERVGPNPGPGPLRFAITLPQAGVVDWSLVDVAGRVIAARRGLALPAGRSTIDASDVGPLRPGTYFARLDSAGRGITRSVIVLQ